jgi:transposase
MPKPEGVEQSALMDVEAGADGSVSRKRPVDKTFRRYDQDQAMLLPPDLRDWVAADHPARWVDDLVEQGLDLSEIYAGYTEARGAPPFDPRLMLKILIYGYSHGVTSSRELERRCTDDVAFRFLTGNTCPDFVAIARFRTRHGAALKGLFTQSLMLCARAGLVSLGKVALDGTKVRADASRHRAMSYQRMVRAEAELAAEVEELLAQARAVDAAQDAAFGTDRRGDELPTELARRQSRLAVIRAARRQLEDEHADRARAAAEARARAAAEANAEAPEQDAKAHQDENDESGPGGGPGPGQDAITAAGDAAAATASVPGKAQRSFTDPDARIMKTSDGSFQYCFNGQVIVDEAHQVVLAGELRQSPADAPALPGMLAVLRESLSQAGIDGLPHTLLADAGYFSADNITAATEAGIDPLIATGRLPHGQEPPPAPRGRIPGHLSPKARMARKLRTKKGKAGYARRKAIVEPVFGQIQVAQHGDRLRLRGKVKADFEWLFHLGCHNFRKLAGSGWNPRMASC